MSALIPALIDLLISRMRKGGGGGGGGGGAAGGGGAQKSAADKEEYAWNKIGYGADPPRPYQPQPLPEMPRFRSPSRSQPK